MQCDYPNCGFIAVATFDVIDDDGEDQGKENLCARHAPHYRPGKHDEDAHPELEAWFDGLKRAQKTQAEKDQEGLTQALLEWNLALIELNKVIDNVTESSKKAASAIQYLYQRNQRKL